MFNKFRNASVRRLPKVLSLVMAAALAVSGCSLLPQEDEPLKPPLVKPATIQTVTVEAKYGSIVKSISGVASLEPTKVVHHWFTFGGRRVQEVLVKPGDRVRKGDLLLRLEMQNLETELLQRQIDVEKKRLALDEARAQHDDRRIRIAALELQLSEKLLESVREQVEARELKAEMDGVVTFVHNFRPGEMIEAYQVLVSVADVSQLHLAYRLNGSEDLTEVSLGMTAELRMGEHAFSGKVVQTPASAPFTEDTRLQQTYARTMYIQSDEIPEGAELGALVDVKIVTAQKENVIVIPKRALRRYLGRSYVQILDGETRRDVDVETGLETSTEVEIVRGLQEGQLVVLQ